MNDHEKGKPGQLGRGIEKNTRMTPSSLGVLASVLLAALSTPQAKAQMPDRTTLVVPFAAGGPSDVLARNVADFLQKRTGKTFIVLNRPGAGGSLAAREVNEGPKDGSIALSANNGIVIGSLTIPNFGANLTKMEKGGIYSFGPLVFVAEKDFPGGTVQEFAQMLEADQNKANLGDGGRGSPAYLCTAQLMKQPPYLKATIVPFTGAGQALVALMRGDIRGLCALTADSLAHIQAGNVKLLAVSRPLPQLPDAQTFEQQGLPKIEDVTNWIFFPEGTPEPVVGAFSKALAAITQDPEFEQRLSKLGLTPNKLPDDPAAISGEQSQVLQDMLGRYPLLLK